MRVCALIPVYNNVDTIAEVVKRCRTVIEPDVFVVSDGSTDNSDKAAYHAGANLISLPKNRGKGYAIRRGLEETQKLDYTHAIVLDADLLGNRVYSGVKTFTDRKAAQNHCA